VNDKVLRHGACGPSIGLSLGVRQDALSDFVVGAGHWLDGARDRARFMARMGGTVPRRTRSASIHRRLERRA
jgi:hypothetical protein